MPAAEIPYEIQRFEDHMRGPMIRNAKQERLFDGLERQFYI